MAQKPSQNTLTKKHLLGYALGDLGSWAAFRFIWNITPDIRSELSRPGSTPLP